MINRDGGRLALPIRQCEITTSQLFLSLGDAHLRLQKISHNVKPTATVSRCISVLGLLTMANPGFVEEQDDHPSMG
jgi:hypothetical protein